MNSDKRESGATLHDVVEVMESIATVARAEPWDNVGLLAGDPKQPVSRVALTIDYTPEVACEAAGLGCDAVIAYHPPIFKPHLSRVTADGPGGSIFDAIRRGVGIYSPHTALDVAVGGTNDVLADAVGIGPARTALKPSATHATHCKLVTFVPAEATERLSQALFDAGAGRIGDYHSCSFRTEGTGTFFGTAGTHPAVGQAGQLEQVSEVRLETLVPLPKLEAVLSALRKTHPYEEPAYDVLQLLPSSEAGGIGRVGDLIEAAPVETVCERVKRELELTHLLVAGPIDQTIRRAAVCAGACGELLEQAMHAGVQLYVTGEMRHHDALRAARAGLTVICTLHSNSERATLKRLAQQLRQRLPEVAFTVAASDRDPFLVR